VKTIFSEQRANSAVSETFPIKRKFANSLVSTEVKDPLPEDLVVEQKKKSFARSLVSVAPKGDTDGVSPNIKVQIKSK
jgi:hypothetical protein